MPPGSLGGMIAFGKLQRIFYRFLPRLLLSFFFLIILIIC